MTARARYNTLAVLMAITLVLGFAATAPAGEDGQEVQKIKVKHRIHCEGDDCGEGHDSGHKVIFIDGEGNENVIEGDYQWVGEGGPHKMKMMMHGAHKGGFLGVGLTELTPELRAHFGVPEGSGVMVSKVVEDSPAERAGVAVGDIITLVDAEEVASGGALAHAISGREDGSNVTLEIWRDGQAQQLTATVEEREKPRMAMMPRMRMRGGDGESVEKRIIIDCDSDDGECGGGGIEDYDCGGAEECQVQVECTDGGCTCTVNGEEADCAGIPGVPQQ